MSEHEEPRIELNQSKVEISRNAKGDAQWRVVVAEGATDKVLNDLRQIAVAQHLALGREVLGVDFNTGQVVP